MGSTGVISLACLVLVLSEISYSFRIRRSGVAGYDDPYGLTNALSSMDRRRRTDYRTMLRKRVLEDESYFNPNSEPVEYIKTSPFIAAQEDSYDFRPTEIMFDKSYLAPLEEYPVPYSALDERMYGPQKRRAYTPFRVVPTVDELRTLFGEADVPMKRMPPVKRQEPKQQEVKAEIEPQAKIDKDAKVAVMRELLSAAEKQAGEDVIDVDPGLDMEPADDVVDESMETEDTQDDVDSETTDDVGEIPEDVDNEEDINDEDVVMQTSDFGDYPDDAPQIQSKSKRAPTSGGVTSEYVAYLLNEIAELKEKLSKFELLKMLEDKENDYLANALKYAALDQVEDDDMFVGKEYDDITKATETESIIQSLTGGGDLDESEEDDVLDEDMDDNAVFLEPDEDDDDIVKRSEPIDLDLDPSGEWLDNPVREKVGIGALLEDNETGEPDVYSEGPGPFLELPDLQEELEADEDDEDEEDDIVLEAEEAAEEAGEKHILSELLSNLSPGTVESIIADLQSKPSSEVSTQSDDICNPVFDLSKQCAFADAIGIPIDEDARNLCVRHQLCYTCGSEIGISEDSCNAGYRGTVVGACQGDTSCLKDAAIFLNLMTRFHDYADYSPLECKNPCVQDFIIGVE